MISKDTSVEKIMKMAEPCEQCGKCCTYGSGCLINEDVQKMASFMNITEEELKNDYLEEVEIFNTKLLRPKFKKPYGRCVFLDADNTCKIHEAKPLQCKLCNPCSGVGEELSEWFKLNFCVNTSNAESIRQWAIYLEDNKTIQGGELKDLVPNNERLKKILSFEEL
ncbi:MAG: YkgJ family cysteine cluster protein [Nanoarchaeota archaeon]|nr:YkgJ family cysteine cluster protein [Nanoarchaeota archaeon]